MGNQNSLQVDVQEEEQNQASRRAPRPFHSIPGTWHSWNSTEPLTEAIQFAMNYSQYVCDMKEKHGGAPLIKIHPGLQCVLVTDYAAGAYVMGSGTDKFDREPKKRFASAAVHPVIVGNACPALTSSTSSGHDSARQYVITVMRQRMPDLHSTSTAALDEAISVAMDYYKKKQDEDEDDGELMEVFPYCLYLVANIIFRWIFEMPATEDDVNWYFKRILANLQVDNLASWFAKPSIQFSEEDHEVLNRLLKIVTDSPRWESLKNTAAIVGIPEAASDKDLAHTLLFTFMAGSYGVSLGLFPSILRLSSTPDIVSALRDEFEKMERAAEESAAGSERKGKGKLTESYEEDLSHQESKWIGTDNLFYNASSKECEQTLLTSTCLELLRLYPAPTYFCREAKQDIILPTSSGETYTIPSGTKCLVSAAHLHTDPSAFPGGQEFQPRRYLDHPEQMDRLYVFGIPFSAISGGKAMLRCPRSRIDTAKRCPFASSNSTPAPRVNPHGCAAAEVGFAFPLFKYIIATFVKNYQWSLDQQPVHNDPRYFGFAGPINVKFRSFDKRTALNERRAMVSQVDYWELLKEGSEKEQFAAACNLAKANATKINRDTGTILYGLYKQAECGDAPTAKPHTFNFQAQNKWGVWNAYRGIGKEAARKQYVETVIDALQDVYSTAEETEEKSPQNSPRSLAAPVYKFTLVENGVENGVEESLLASNAGVTVSVLFQMKGSPMLKSHVPGCKQVELLGNFVDIVTRATTGKGKETLSLTVAGVAQDEEEPLFSFRVDNIAPFILSGGVGQGELTMDIPLSPDACNLPPLVGLAFELMLTNKETDEKVSLTLPSVSWHLHSARIDLTQPTSVDTTAFDFDDWVSEPKFYMYSRSLTKVPAGASGLQLLCSRDLEGRKRLWKWDKAPVDGIPPGGEFHAICDITDERAFARAPPVAPLSSFRSSEEVHRAKTLKDFEDIYELIGKDKPQMVVRGDWHTDEVFVREFLASTHCHHIRQLKPQGDSNEPAQIRVRRLVMEECPEELFAEEDSKEIAIASGRIFYVSYDEFDNIVTRPVAPTVLPQPTCVFYQPPLRRGTPRSLKQKAAPLLRVLLIEMDSAQSSNVFAGAVALPPHSTDPTTLSRSPEDRKYRWLLAKALTRCADINYFQVVPHYLFAHHGTEQVCVAARRALPACHPIHKILRPHLAGTCVVNIIARVMILLVSIPRLFSIGDGAKDLLQWAWKDERLHKRFSDLRTDLSMRGVLDPSQLPHYPYRDDGLKICGALHKYVSHVLQLAYGGSNAQVREDVHLQQFVGELRTVGYLLPSTDPLEKPDCLAAITTFLVNLIFNASVFHATMNYSLYESASFAPFSPLFMNLPTRTGADSDGMVMSEEKFLQCLPSLEMQVETVVGLAFLSHPAPADTHLSELHVPSDCPLAPLAQQLQHDMEAISKAMHQRNQEREDTRCTLLLPEAVPSSVTL